MSAKIEAGKSIAYTQKQPDVPAPSIISSTQDGLLHTKKTGGLLAANGGKTQTDLSYNVDGEFEMGFSADPAEIFSALRCNLMGRLITITKKSVKCQNM